METTLNPAAPPSRQRLMRSILVVMMGFVLTKGVSFLQTIIIANRFGAGADYDTFAAGSVVPDYIVRLIGGGALGVAFIPVFSALLNQNDYEGAWKLASQVFNTLLLTALALSLIVMLFATPLVDHVVASGLPDNQVEQTANLMRILALASVLFCVSGLVSGVLHGHNHFFLPVLAPIFQDLGLLFGVIFFLDPFGIYGLAWGTLLGAVLHLGIQIPGLVRIKFRWQPLLGWRDPRLRHVLTLMLPRIIIGVTFVVDLLVITNVNSRLGEGAISAFSWGVRFMDIPQALLGTAIGIVIFPTLAALTSLGEVEKRREAFAGAMRFILVATIPAAAGLVMVSYDALRILFDEYDASIILTSIQVLSLAIIFQSLHEVLTRAFYAQQDTLRPLIFAVIASVITVLQIVLFYQFYRSQANLIGVRWEGSFNNFRLIPQFDPPLSSFWAVGGPALGYVLSFALEVFMLGYVLRRRWGDIALPEMLQAGIRSLLGTGVMLGAIFLTRQLIQSLGFDTYATSHIGVRILSEVGIGGIVFFITAWLLRIPEIRHLPALIRQIIRSEHVSA